MHCGVKVKVASQLGGGIMCRQMPQPNAVTKTFPFIGQAPKLMRPLLFIVEIQTFVLQAIWMLTKEKQ